MTGPYRVREDTGEPYLVTLGTGRAAAATNVTFSVTNMNKSMLQYTSHGSLIDFTKTPVIRLTHGDESIELHISTSTGTITEVEVTP